jgi:hypothetical protein
LVYVCIHPIKLLSFMGRKKKTGTSHCHSSQKI